MPNVRIPPPYRGPTEGHELVSVDGANVGECLEALVARLAAPSTRIVSLTVTEAMHNFHGMTHGGVIFSLGDIAFAAASNS